MDKDLLLLIELLLVVGVVFGLGFWQLASLKPKKRREKAERDDEGKPGG